MPHQVGHDILRKEMPSRNRVRDDKGGGHDKSTNFPSFSQNASATVPARMTYIFAFKKQSFTSEAN